MKEESDTRGHQGWISWLRWELWALDCHAVVCTDNSENDAQTAMAEAGHKRDCINDACKINFLMLCVIHDGCEHNTLSKIGVIMAVA